MESVEYTFRQIAAAIALAAEFAGVLLVLIGGVEALYRGARNVRSGFNSLEIKKETFLHYAAWITLALEFELGADIVRTAISPTWDAIGQLAAIAGIRTVLNFFLGRDLESATRREVARAQAGAAAAPGTAP